MTSSRSCRCVSSSAALARSSAPATPREVGDLLAGEQHVLDRVVVQRLGEPAPLTGRGVQPQLHEAAAARREVLEHPLATADQR